jgi:hypothetical protein
MPFRFLENAFSPPQSGPLIFKGLAKQGAEIAAGLQAPCPIFGSYRKRIMPTVVPIVRHLPGSDSNKAPPAHERSLYFQSAPKRRQKCLERCRVQQNMKTETAENPADLYWLAFLLTGREDVSIDIAADAATSEDDLNPFFADWMRGWQRRLVIGKALTEIHDQLADSARRTEIARVDSSGMPRNWSLSPDTTKADLERALLAIDLFPRAAVLLLVFEGVRIADAATLLDADPGLLKKAEAIGLRELTANLAATNASAVSAPPRGKCGFRRLAEAPKKLFGSMRTAAVCS